MSVQTTYTLDHAEAYAGMKADQQVHNAVSKTNLGASIIPYGKAIVTDTETGGKLPTGASVAKDFIGVAMRELNRALADGDVLGAVIDNDFSVFTHGVIWVTVLDTVAKDADVYMRIGATGLGDFSGVIGAGVTEGILLPGVKFVTGGDAGDLVKISIGVGG